MSLAAPHDDVPPTVARLLGGLGRLFIAVGVLLLLFAGFQLWGTGLAEARAQDDLEQRFLQQLAETRAVAEEPSESALSSANEDEAATDGSGAGDQAETDQAEAEPAAGADRPVLVVPQTAEPVTRPATPRPQPTIDAVADPEPGDPVGVLEIPAIGVRKAIVEGTSRDVLRSGPGHYRSTPLPGRSGNAAIAGHRTTHGAPFFDIDLLQPGDEIQVETLDGTATYLVEGHDDGYGSEIGHLIVDPSEVGVIADKGDDRLTLTACHPKYSARQRIVVTATLVTAPTGSSPVPSAQSPAETTPPADAVPFDGADPAVAGPNQPLPDPAADSTTDATLNATLDATSNATSAADPTGGLAFADEPTGAELADEPTGDQVAAFEPTEADTGAVAASLGWQPQFATATGLWAGATALVALAGWLAARFWRRWPSYALAVPPFSLTLYYCFANLEKFLPAV